MSDIVLVGNQTRYAQLIAWRVSLKLEAKGFTRSGGRSLLSQLKRSALDILDPESGEVLRTIDPLVKSRTAKGAYEELNAIIVELMGPEFDRPLPADFKRIV